MPFASLARAGGFALLLLLPPVPPPRAHAPHGEVRPQAQAHAAPPRRLRLALQVPRDLGGADGGK